MSSVQNKHYNIPGLTELENSFLKEDPLNAITFLQVKYSNNRKIHDQLNQYIDVNNLTKHKNNGVILWYLNNHSTLPITST